MKNELERRNHNEAVGVRVEENGTHILTGYAARFNTLSQNLGGFVEVVDPTAFNQTIGESDVRALFNHDINHVIGRLSANTLRLVVDEVGLKYEIDLPDTAAGRDLARRRAAQRRTERRTAGRAARSATMAKGPFQSIWHAG